MILSIVLTVGLVAFQRRVIRQTGSMAIGADSLHYSGDLFMNLAVIAALVITNATGIRLVDPIFALGIAAFLVFGATRIAKGSLDTLMDRELPHGDRKRIREIVMAHPATRDMHDLRTRNAGNTVFIELHLELDSHLTLAAAHDITDEVESQLMAAFPRPKCWSIRNPTASATSGSIPGSPKPGGFGAGCEILTPIPRSSNLIWRRATFGVGRDAETGCAVVDRADTGRLPGRGAVRAGHRQPA